MKNKATITLFCMMLLSSSVAVPDEAFAQETAHPMQGNWISRGSRSILGEGGDHVISLQAENQSWTLFLATIYYPARNADEPPRKLVRGPFKAQIEDGVLTFTEDGKKHEYTVRTEKDVLVCPAFRRIDDRTWEIRSPDFSGKTKRAVFQCEHDYTNVPVGKTISPVGFYSYERDEQNRNTKYLRFLVRLKDGTLSEKCRLVWDERGSPRFQGHSAYRKYQQGRYVNKLSTGQDDYNRVLEINASFRDQYRVGARMRSTVRIKNLGPLFSEIPGKDSTAQLFPYVTVWVAQNSKLTVENIPLPIENRIRIKQWERFECDVDLSKARLLTTPGEYDVSIGHFNSDVTDLGDWTGTLRSRTHKIIIRKDE